MKSILLFGLCFTLFLVLVFGSVNSSSFHLPKTAFASDDADHTTGDSGGGDNSNHGDDNQGGDTGDQGNDHGDGSHGMPPPEDAPAATGTITAGGGGSDDDDEDDNDNSDNDNDNDNDNPQIPKDAPATSDALTAKQIECLPGQEVSIFSTTCEPSGGGTDGTTSAVTVCPTSPTPTSYGMPDRSLVTNTVWGFNEAETEQQDMRKSLLHRVQGSTGPENPITNCPPGREPAEWVMWDELPPAASPYRGNEPQLVNFYGNPDPANPNIERTDKVGNYVLTTFDDDTIKKAKLESVILSADDESDDVDFIESDVSITPGPGTPLDKLGVLQVKIPDSGQGGTVTDRNTIIYKDGKSIERQDAFSNTFQLFHILIHKDSKGNVIETIKGGVYGTHSIKSDGTRSDFFADGSYLTTWPKKADGSQQFYDSKQQKVFVRDANGNVIPPKE